MNITFVTKRVDGSYEAALVVDDKFQRAASAKGLNELYDKLVAPLLAQDQADGAEVQVKVTFMTAAEVAREQLRAERQRRTAEATAEAAEIEKLTEALSREQVAVDAAKAAIQ